MTGKELRKLYEATLARGFDGAYDSVHSLIEASLEAVYRELVEELRASEAEVARLRQETSAANARAYTSEAELCEEREARSISDVRWEAEVARLGQEVEDVRTLDAHVRTLPGGSHWYSNDDTCGVYNGYDAALSEDEASCSWHQHAHSEAAARRAAVEYLKTRETNIPRANQLPCSECGAADHTAVGHSTPALPEEWHVVDEVTGAPSTVAGRAWVGSERRAKLEAERLTRETGRRHEARRVR